MDMSLSSSAPDLLFVDATLLAYRLGLLRHAEQQAALLAASRAATDAMTFMTAVENFGIMRGSQLHSIVGRFLAAPAYYRNQYRRMLGLRQQDEAVELFLSNPYVLYLVEGLLTPKQRKLFFDLYWWFVHNHQNDYVDPKKGHVVGAYATLPQDNASTLPRFEEYLSHLVNHHTKAVRERYEGFPADMVAAILKRAFLSA